tara:strand:+ start:383 stop:577 length:195 start_codon:yes stop_codon:yes gene_type:complete
MTNDDEESKPDTSQFEAVEIDKLIRQIVDRVRGNYFLNGENARGMPAEIKRIIESNIDRISDAH